MSAATIVPPVPAASAPIAVGDLVQLKSKSTTMTVVGLTKAQGNANGVLWNVTCAWLGNYVPYEATYPLQALIFAPVSPPASA